MTLQLRARHATLIHLFGIVDKRTQQDVCVNGEHGAP